MAAITVLSVAEPFWSSARRLMMLAFGAMPRNVTSQLPQAELSPLPAMMPATCVPCPYRSLLAEHCLSVSSRTAACGCAFLRRAEIFRFSGEFQFSPSIKRVVASDAVGELLPHNA
jgi:hypothetical protein